MTLTYRAVSCKVCGKLHERYPNYEPCDKDVRPQRSDLPTPLLNLDTMEPTQHPVTGEYLTSKSQFRKITKAHGREEIGDQTHIRPEPKVDKITKDEIMQAVNKLKQGYKPQLGKAIDGLDNSPTF